MAIIRITSKQNGKYRCNNDESLIRIASWLENEMISLFKFKHNAQVFISIKLFQANYFIFLQIDSLQRHAAEMF